MVDRHIFRDLKNIKKETVETVKACLAIQKFNLPITSYLVESLVGKIRIGSLHMLGDKEVLILKRTGRQKLEWIINPIFLKFYNREIETLGGWCDSTALSKHYGAIFP